MGNDGAGRVQSVPYEAMIAAIVAFHKRLGAGQGYSARTPYPDEAALVHWRNRLATVPARQNTTSYPTPVVGCLIASKSP